MAKHNKAREAAQRRVAEQRAAGASQPLGSAAPREVKMPRHRFSRGKTIGALVVVLALVVAGYCALPLIFPEEEEETTEEELLLNISEDDITAISWTYDEQTTAVELDEDDTWVLSDGSDAELDQDSVSSIASYLASATVARSISTDAVTDEMGLDEGVVEAQITLSDDSTITLVIGSYDDSGSYTYVSATADGSQQVALVSYTLLSALATDVTQLYEMEDAPAASQIDSLTIEADGQTFLLSYIEGGSEELSYTSEYEWFAGTDESDLTAVSDSSASLVTTVVNNVSWTSCVDPDHDGSVDYGFDDPTLTAVLEYTNEESVDTGEVDDDGEAIYETQEVQGSFTLIVGDMTSDGLYYYAQPEGSSAVYTLSADDVETLLEASVESLAADDICLMDWDTVDSIDITYGGTTTTIEIVREESDDEDADDESNEDDEDSDDVETTYYIDGEEVDSSSVEDLLGAIEDLAAESEADGDAVGEDFEISFTFYRNTSSFTEMTLGFIQYDNSFYLVSFNDEERLLVNRNDVAELIELFEALL